MVQSHLPLFLGVLCLNERIHVEEWHKVFWETFTGLRNVLPDALHNTAPLDRVGEGNSVAQGFEGKPWASVRSSSIRKVTGRPATTVSVQDKEAEPDIWQNLHTAQSFHLGGGAADETWDRRGRVQWHTSRL